jgi:hypothetical protein
MTPMKYRYFARKFWRAAAQIRKLPETRQPIGPRFRTNAQWAAGVAREGDVCARLGSPSRPENLSTGPALSDSGVT